MRNPSNASGSPGTVIATGLAFGGMTAQYSPHATRMPDTIRMNAMQNFWFGMRRFLMRMTSRTMSRRKKNGVEKMRTPEHQATGRSAARGRKPANRTN